MNGGGGAHLLLRFWTQGRVILGEFRRFLGEKSRRWSFREIEGGKMSGLDISVETVNAAASAIIQAESRVQQVTSPVKF